MAVPIPRLLGDQCWDDDLEWYGKMFDVIEGRVLVVGCGKSDLSFIRGGLAIDLAIDRTDRRECPPGVEFARMDVKKLDLPADSFDAVVDKACLDSLFASNGVRTAIAEIRRVLKPGGKFYCVTHGAPAARIPYLFGRVDHAPFNDAHLYTCTKPKKDV